MKKEFYTKLSEADCKNLLRQNSCILSGKLSWIFKETKTGDVAISTLGKKNVAFFSVYRNEYRRMFCKISTIQQRTKVTITFRPRKRDILRLLLFYSYFLIPHQLDKIADINRFIMSILYTAVVVFPLIIVEIIVIYRHRKNEQVLMNFIKDLLQWESYS